MEYQECVRNNGFIIHHLSMVDFKRCERNRRYGHFLTPHSIYFMGVFHRGRVGNYGFVRGSGAMFTKSVWVGCSFLACHGGLAKYQTVPVPPPPPQEKPYWGYIYLLYNNIATENTCKDM